MTRNNNSNGTRRVSPLHWRDKGLFIGIQEGGGRFNFGFSSTGSKRILLKNANRDLKLIAGNKFL